MILICAVCGAHAPGKQWWNRDTGFGVCERCFTEEVARSSLEEAIFNYGKPGIHHSIKPAKPEISVPG